MADKDSKIVPDYKKIYSDLVREYFPDQVETFKPLLDKTKMSSIDIIKISEKILLIKNGNKRQERQKYRSYSMSDIIQILEFQKSNKLNNTQLALHFKLSRNTVAKWKNYYTNKI